MVIKILVIAYFTIITINQLFKNRSGNFLNLFIETYRKVEEDNPLSDSRFTKNLYTGIAFVVALALFSIHGLVLYYVLTVFSQHILLLVFLMSVKSFLTAMYTFNQFAVISLNIFEGNPEKIFESKFDSFINSANALTTIALITLIIFG